jgi:hypothetical protein
MVILAITTTQTPKNTKSIEIRFMRLDSHNTTMMCAEEFCCALT